ncbi:putative filament-like plant protein [Dioscorea sansibarensis]
MDRRSWLWRRKSSEKSPGETESSGSVSSLSERFSDDHEASRASPNTASPSFGHSPDVSSKTDNIEVNETVKSLTEKLSAALSNISAKEELVKQHAKVTEEAVSGWEKAENEVVTLKQQLEAASQKNSALEDRIGHLDGALKECVRELRQSREEQEQKIRDVIIKNSCDWEPQKLELESRMSELRTQLEAAKAEALSLVDPDFRSILEQFEKENLALKLELVNQAKDLQMLILERDLSIQAAETASKQHLESIKKITRIESECRRLQSMGCRTSSVNDQKVPSPACLESLTDSLSDCGERLHAVDQEAYRSDSWANALIVELDQFKNEKSSSRDLANSIDIELMDDFLEMERLVSLPETENGSSTGCSKVKTDALHWQLTELEAKVEKLESENAELEVALADTRKQLELSTHQLTLAEIKLTELQRQLDFADKSKQLAMIEVVDAEERRQIVESQLESTQSEVKKLSEKIYLLELNSEKEKAMYVAVATKLEAAATTIKDLESQLQSAVREAGQLHDKVGLLEREVEEKTIVSSQLGSVKKELELELETSNMKVNAMSAEFTGKVETLEIARTAIESQLELSQLEVRKLQDKVRVLEREIEAEKASVAVFASKCRDLEDELSKRKQETELRQSAFSNGDLKIKQDQERVIAAGKLAECQKTIDSLNRHLQLLATFDDFMIENEMPELGCDSAANAESSLVLNGKNGGPSPSLVPSSSSSFYEIARHLSRNRIIGQIEN